MVFSKDLDIQVLIVDDLPMVRAAANRIFTQLNCKVDVIANAAKALEQLHRATYDIIFIDVYLPDLNGLSLGQTIRSIERRGTRVPLIAFSASNDRSLKIKSRSYGFDDYILKPLTEEAVKQILLKHLSKLKTEDRNFKR